MEAGESLLEKHVANYKDGISWRSSFLSGSETTGALKSVSVLLLVPTRDVVRTAGLRGAVGGAGVTL